MAGKDRKRQLARQRYERQLQRRAARQARARRMKIIGIVVVVALAAGGSGAIAYAMSGSSKKKPAAAPSSPTPTPVKPGECGYQPLPSEASQYVKNVGTPPAKPVKAKYRMTIDTKLGKIVATLDGTKAPCTVNSFNYLASKKFFHNTICHRLTTKSPKVLQCGDPSGTGQGGPSYGYANENVPKAGKKKLPDGSPAATYKRGVIGVAHGEQPNSNGSQFFIVYGDSDLPPDYTIIGTVTEGLDIVDSVAKAGTDSSNGPGDGKPKKRVEIKDLVVAKM